MGSIIHDKVISMFDKLNSGVQEIRHEGVVEYLSYLHKQLELEKKGEVNDFSKENPEEALSTIKNLIDELEHENDLYNKLEEVSSSPEFKVKWELIDKKLESEDEQEVNEGRRELTELAKETLKMEKNGIKSGASKSILKFMHENFPELDK